MKGLKQIKKLLLLSAAVALLLFSCQEHAKLISRGLNGENLYEMETYGDEISSGADVQIIELKGFNVEDFHNEMVQKYLKLYRTRWRNGFQIILNRAQIYLPYIRQVFEEEGIPEDLAYLPIIESSFNAYETSHAGAQGLWQFIPPTGRLYGLRQNYWYDERRDPEKSTKAAAKHLKRLYRNFKNWAIVLAAYNAGGGRIGRAIRKKKTNNLWELIRLDAIPTETKWYVPKFIAATLIAKNPERYGFSVNEPRVSFPNYDKVYIDDAADLSIIAKAIKSDVRTLKILNPELNQWITPPKVKKYPLRIPKGKKKLFNETFGSIPAEKRVTFRKHILRSGETLWHLSKFYGIPSSAIASINKIDNPNRLFVGNSYIIPIRGLNNAEQVDMKSYRIRIQKERSGRYVYFKNLPKPEYDFKDIVYCVGSDDTLWDISRHFNIDVDEIKAWNKISGKYISAGDELFIRIPLNKGKEEEDSDSASTNTASTN